MIEKGMISTLTFDRKVSHKQTIIRGLKLFEDNNDVVFLQPLNADNRDMRSFIPVPKESIEELIELLTYMKNKR